MIEAKYLDQAIAQNLGEESPDAWTCMRLAAQLYIRDRLYGGQTVPAKQSDAKTRSYAMADAPEGKTTEIVAYKGKTDFARAIDGKNAALIWPILDDVMSLFATLHPELYENAIKILKTK